MILITALGIMLFMIVIYMCFNAIDFATGSIVLSNMLTALSNINGLYIIIGLVFSLLIADMITPKKKRLSGKKKQVEGDMHGSGAFDNINGVKQKYQAFKFSEYNEVENVKSGWLVYYDEKTRTHYFDTDTVSALTVAPARRFKTSSVTIVEVLYNIKSRASMFIPDPKAEIIDYIKPILDLHKKKTIVYNMSNTEYSDKYNLISVVAENWDKHLEAKEKGDKNNEHKYLAECQQSAIKIAEQMIVSTKREDTGNMHSFFLGTSVGWIATCILLVIQFAPKEKRHFPSVISLALEIANNSIKSNVLGIILNNVAEQHGIDNIAVASAGGSATAQEELLNNVTSSVLDALLPFQNKAILNVFNKTDYNDIEATIGDTYTFLIFPLDNDSACAIASLMTSQTIEGLSQVAKNNKNPKNVGRLDHPYKYELEEIGNIKEVKKLEKYLSLFQGLGITFSLVFQDDNQIKFRYGNKADTIIKNADLKRYVGFNSDDTSTAKRVSESLGNITVESSSQSVSHGTTNTGRNQQSITTSVISRPLMTVDEVINNENSIILKSPNKPLQTKFVPHFKEEFGMKLERSGYEGELHGYKDIELFRMSELIEILGMDKNNNVVEPTTQKPTPITEAESLKIIELFDEYNIPYAYELLHGELTEQMKREIELALLQLNEKEQKSLNKYLEKL